MTRLHGIKSGIAGAAAAFTSSDTRDAASVASSSDLLPIIGTVPVAGAAPVGDYASVKQAIQTARTITIDQASASRAGIKFPAGVAIDPVTVDIDNAAGYMDDGCNRDVTDLQHELLGFLDGGERAQLSPIFTDNAELVATMVADGFEPDSLVRDHYSYRAARRKLCSELRRYIAAVETDDARRDREQEGAPAAAAAEADSPIG